ncbi:MAG TPA: c(7)-type cytochrome triheme domain-containing protein [Desulfuromonadaceae bacterium]
MRRAFIVLMISVGLTGLVLAEEGVKKNRLRPYEFGMVTISQNSMKAGISPVIFDHWLHRAKFTCRLCHLDIGFGMKTGATNIRAANNIRGFYCGTCHNGKTTFADKTVFAACSKNPSKDDEERCKKCHSTDRDEKRETDFLNLIEKFPKERLGNGVDWEKAEELGMIKPIDFLEGISLTKPPQKLQKDFTLDSKFEGMPDIIFSHKKHTVWNGCEVCHPKPFVGVKKGSTKYSMLEIFNGKFCGLCHYNVAFPVTDCQRCHRKPIQR